MNIFDGTSRVSDELYRKALRISNAYALYNKSFRDPVLIILKDEQDDLHIGNCKFDSNDLREIAEAILKQYDY